MSTPTIPISNNQANRFGELEWAARKELAACYRLADMFGFSDIIWNHITAKIPDTEHFLINRFGLGGFAEFMGLYSVLERRVNRAWSAAADGVHEEAVDCLTRAVQEARQVQDWLHEQA